MKPQEADNHTGMGQEELPTLTRHNLSDWNERMRKMKANIPSQCEESSEDECNYKSRRRRKQGDTDGTIFDTQSESENEDSDSDSDSESYGK